MGSVLSEFSWLYPTTRTTATQEVTPGRGGGRLDELEEHNELRNEKSGKIGGLEQDSICDTIGNLDSRSISVESS
jgi:hypothetical protein